jgi:hypothetical protein
MERFLRLGFGCDDDQRGCFAVNSMRELAGLPTEAQEIISSRQQKLTRLLIKNIEAEEPKLNASMIADVVLTFFHGFCIAQNLKSGKASSERKIRNLMQVVRPRSTASRFRVGFRSNSSGDTLPCLSNHSLELRVLNLERSSV